MFLLKSDPISSQVVVGSQLEPTEVVMSPESLSLARSGQDISQHEEGKGLGSQEMVGVAARMLKLASVVCLLFCIFPTKSLSLRTHKGNGG